MVPDIPQMLGVMKAMVGLLPLLGKQNERKLPRRR
jgi:hypothetical protein